MIYNNNNNNNMSDYNISNNDSYILNYISSNISELIKELINNNFSQDVYIEKLKNINLILNSLNKLDNLALLTKLIYDIIDNKINNLEFLNEILTHISNREYVCAAILLLNIKYNDIIGLNNKEYTPDCKRNYSNDEKIQVINICDNNKLQLGSYENLKIGDIIELNNNLYIIENLISPDIIKIYTNQNFPINFYKTLLDNTDNTYIQHANVSISLKYNNSNTYLTNGNNIFELYHNFEKEKKESNINHNFRISDLIEDISVNNNAFGRTVFGRFNNSHIIDLTPSLDFCKLYCRYMISSSDNSDIQVRLPQVTDIPTEKTIGIGESFCIKNTDTKARLSILTPNTNQFMADLAPDATAHIIALHGSGDRAKDWQVMIYGGYQPNSPQIFVSNSVKIGSPDLSSNSIQIGGISLSSDEGIKIGNNSTTNEPIIIGSSANSIIIGDISSNSNSNNDHRPSLSSYYYS